MLTYFGRVRFKGRLPGGLVAVALGTLLVVGRRASRPSARARSRPRCTCRCRSSAISSPRSPAATSLPYLSVIIAMGLFNVLGSLQNIESAEAAGDSYDTRPSLTVNGIGSIAAALFGSAFPTTIYIGHPGLEGARRARRLLGAERRVRHGHLPDRHARAGSPGRSRSTPAWRSCCGSAS